MSEFEELYINFNTSMGASVRSKEQFENNQRNYCKDYQEDAVHVIEYAALEQAEAKIKELEAKLSIAVERLEKLAVDGYANQIDKRALEKLRGKNEL